MGQVYKPFWQLYRICAIISSAHPIDRKLGFREKTNVSKITQPMSYDYSSRHPDSIVLITINK